LCLRSEVVAGVSEPNLDREWQIMQAVAGSGVPIPHVYCFESTTTVTGARFIAMEWVNGEVPNPWRRAGKQFLAAAAARGNLGPDWVRAIVRLHSAPVAGRLVSAGVDSELTMDRFLVGEIEHWSTIIESAANHPGALVVEACHWLRDNPPQTAGPITALHGDLRMGNLIVAEDRVVALLDWEMAGLGDWRADLGYCLMPYNGGKLLEHHSPTAGGLMAPEAFLELYESESGRRLSPDEAAYFMVLGSVKMIAIFCTAIDQYAAGRSTDPRFAWLSIPLAGLVDDIVGLLESGVRW
jgi:aminoglycoside phosphotransferase (APT) family kinase protein